MLVQSGILNREIVPGLIVTGSILRLWGHALQAAAVFLIWLVLLFFVVAAASLVHSTNHLLINQRMVEFWNCLGKIPNHFVDDPFSLWLCQAGFRNPFLPNMWRPSNRLLNKILPNTGIGKKTMPTFTWCSMRFAIHLPRVNAFVNTLMSGQAKCLALAVHWSFMTLAHAASPVINLLYNCTALHASWACNRAMGDDTSTTFYYSAQQSSRPSRSGLGTT